MAYILLGFTFLLCTTAATFSGSSGILDESGNSEKLDETSARKQEDGEDSLDFSCLGKYRRGKSVEPHPIEKPSDRL